jgi:hypothetical protein
MRIPFRKRVIYWLLLLELRQRTTFKVRTIANTCLQLQSMTLDVCIRIVVFFSRPAITPTGLAGYQQMLLLLVRYRT